MLKSASGLGEKYHLNGQEMNQLLKIKGLLSGAPNNWSVTDKGKPYVNQNLHRRGTGGFSSYNREWTTISWDESVLDSMNITDEDIQAAKAATAEAQRNTKVEAYDNQQQRHRGDKKINVSRTLTTIGVATTAFYSLYLLYDNWHDIKLRWWLFKNRYCR